MSHRGRRLQLLLVLAVLAVSALLAYLKSLGSSEFIELTIYPPDKPKLRFTLKIEKSNNALLYTFIQNGKLIESGALTAAEGRKLTSDLVRCHAWDLEDEFKVEPGFRVAGIFIIEGRRSEFQGAPKRHLVILETLVQIDSLSKGIVRGTDWCESLGERFKYPRPNGIATP